MNVDWKDKSIFEDVLDCEDDSGRHGQLLPDSPSTISEIPRTHMRTSNVAKSSGITDTISKKVALQPPSKCE